MTDNQGRAGGSDLKKNPVGASERNAQTDLAGSGIYVGTITRVVAGYYSCLVTIQSAEAKVVACPLPMQAGVFSGGFGTTDSRLPLESTNVLIYLVDPGAASGIILCIIPPCRGYVDSELEAPVAPLSEETPGKAAFTEAVYGGGVDVGAPAGRVIDAFPGDYTEYNELGVGLAIRKLMTHLRASESAKIECFIPDDLVRIVSGMFEHYSDLGIQRLVNSEGNCTLEFTASPHQCETAGAYAYGTPIVVEAESDEEKARQRAAKLVDPIQPINRFSLYMGALSNGVQFFVSSPDTSGDTRKYSDKANDKGLFHFGIDTSGRLAVSSAAEIVIKRTDKIPVPKKLKEAADPEGDRSVNAGINKPWNWSKPDDPLSKALQLRDAEVWWRRNAYSSFIANALDEDNSSWHIPEDSDIPALGSDYDAVAGHTDSYEEGVDKTCEVVLRKDGGITVRDSEHAEITLAGGKIILTAPNGVEVRSGTSITSIANNDIIQKANKSIDVTANEGDIRVKAQNHLHAHSGESMLLECTATSQVAPGDEPAGENFAGRGLVIKATESSVSLYGGTLNLSALRQIAIETIGSAAGTIVLATKNLIAAALDKVQLAVNTAGLEISNQAALLAGSSLQLIGDSNVSIIRGNEVLKGEYSPTAGGSAGDAIAEFTRITNVYTEEGWLADWSLTARELWVFSYRLDDDYAREYEKLSGDTQPSMYESMWAYIARVGGGSSATPWQEDTILGTYPWPGKAKTTGTDDEGAAVEFYFQLDTEVNIEDAAIGQAKPMVASDEDSELTATGADFVSKPFTEYTG